MENQKTKEQEERFIAWTLARDDDWWEEGHGHFSIWDFRIIQEFFKEEITNALNQERELKEEFKQKLNVYDISSGGIDDDNEMLIALIKDCREFLTKLEGKE